jgi:hypothetical protein
MSPGIKREVEDGRSSHNGIVGDSLVIVIYNSIHCAIEGRQGCFAIRDRRKKGVQASEERQERLSRRGR